MSIFDGDACCNKAEKDLLVIITDTLLFFCSIDDSVVIETTISTLDEDNTFVPDGNNTSVVFS